jgi:small subunit ribosomal protein S4
MKKETLCKKCRRYGTKLFLKGEKCFSPKCLMVKRPYPPGQRGKRRKGPPSEYAKLLAEKQKLRLWYNLREAQLKNYVKKALSQIKKIEDIGHYLIKLLEMRLDNTVYRLGFATSKKQARQLVSHGHFLVNGKPVNVPSYQVKVGDVISVKKQKSKKVVFKELKDRLKKHTLPSHLFLDVEKLEGKVISDPKFEEVAPPVNIHSIFEFYSK